MADLILQGYRAYLSDQGLPYDVVVDLDGRLIRIQVKATMFARRVPQRRDKIYGYLFHIRRAGRGGRRRYSDREFEIIALVGLDVKVIAYMPIDGVRQSLVLRPPGTVPSKNAKRPENIDGFPFAKALESIRGTAPTGAPESLLIARPKKLADIPLFNGVEVH